MHIFSEMRSCLNLQINLNSQCVFLCFAYRLHKHKHYFNRIKSFPQFGNRANTIPMSFMPYMEIKLQCFAAVQHNEDANWKLRVGGRRSWRSEDKENKPLLRSVCTACSHPFLQSLASHQLLPVVVPFAGAASMTPGQNCKKASGNMRERAREIKLKEFSV